MQKPLLFHVWDFTEKIEVRLNDSYIDKIRNLTVKKKIHVKDKRPRLGYGWKKTHQREFTVEKDVKLIALREGHPYHKIAERLYPKKDWHGSDRPLVEHRPFVNIKEFQKIHEVTGLPLEEMEQNVIEVRNHWAGHAEFPMKFPVIANEDWAWLLGLWFSCGGLITRARPTKGGYLTEERLVRYRVDVRVFERKVKPILERIGHTRHLTEVWYIKKGITHPIDKNRRKGVGNTPKKFFTLLRPVREILEKFGLPTEIPDQRHKVGSKYSIRKYHFVVPPWVKRNKGHTHAFIEGYLNGGTVGSNFRVANKEKGRNFLRRTVEIRFGAFNPKESEDFHNLFERFLTKIGITGYRHKISHLKTSQLCWRGYLIHNSKALRLLYEVFDVQKPDLRARLALHYFMNTLLYHVCWELSSTEILILGALIEKPYSKPELIELYRCREEHVETCMMKLQKLDVAQEVDSKWVINPTGYRDQLIKKLWTMELKRRKTIMAKNVLFFSRCNRCSNVIPSNYTGLCGCGGQYVPISRVEALTPLRGHGYNSLIQRIKDQKIPSFSLG